MLGAAPLSLTLCSEQSGSGLSEGVALDTPLLINTTSGNTKQSCGKVTVMEIVFSVMVEASETGMKSGNGAWLEDAAGDCAEAPCCNSRETTGKTFLFPARAPRFKAGGKVRSAIMA